MGRVLVALVYVIVALYFSPAAADIGRVEFEKVNHLIIDTYAPVVAHKFQAVLELNELWYGFGGAFKVDSALKSWGEPRFVITLTGQIPHNPHMNADGYAIVACHEIGHIVGGAPYQKKALVNWSAVEGQADYYATNVCMWRYVHQAKLKGELVSLDAQSTSLCEIFYGDNPDEKTGCLRILSGIIAIQDYFNSTSSQAQPVSITRQDPIVVKETLEKYPSDQCRLDTMMAGLLNIGKPSCWYKR